MAFGDNGVRPFGRDLVGENECRGLEWYRVDYLLGSVVLVGGIAGASFRSGYYLAHGALRLWLRVVPDS